jgi:hypothetical protein
MIRYFLIFGSLIALTLTGSKSVAASDPVKGFLGQYKAICNGTGPNKLKDHWTWIIDAVHQDEDGADDPDSLSILESTLYNERIWVVTFMGPNKAPIEKVEGGVNVTTFESKVSDQQVVGTVDSYAYRDVSRPKPPVYQVHWKATLKLNSSSGVFKLDYKGYNSDDDPDYGFSCQLIRG